MKKRDKVSIIDKKHIGFGIEDLSIISIKKRGLSYIYGLDNDGSRYFCKKEQIKLK